MFFRILKKDLKRKKTMNIILLIFIILAATFVASSANNMVSVMNAVDGYFDKANVPDFWVCMSEESEKDRFLKFADENNYEIKIQEIISLKASDVTIEGRKNESTQNVVLSELKNGTHIFDSDDKEITEVHEGEVYLSSVFCNAQEEEVNIGDKIKVTVNGKTKEFTFKGKTKDAMFGSAMIGMSRLLISEEDYEHFSTEDVNSLYSVCVYMNDTEFQNKFNELEIRTDFNGDYSTIKLMYVMDMIIAAMFLIVSVCLILISMVILRFTINFTMSEEFREIGVMKAIGIRNNKIRSLYITKYLAISVIGAVIGLIVSIPFGNMMLESVSQNIIMPNTEYYYLNVICAIIVAVVVVLFCYFCTRKIKKVSPTAAIRNGENGERYRKKGFMRLKKTRLRPVIFMAVNDISSKIRRYVTMMIIFLLGILLILIPANTVNTLKSDNLITLFNMAECDVVIDDGGMMNADATNRNLLEGKLTDLKKYLNDNGIDADIFQEVLLRMNIAYEGNKTSSIAVQGVGDVTADDYIYLEGDAPCRNGEIAVSHIVADRIGADIGDKVEIKEGNDIKSYIITAIYQTMNNMGEGIRFYQEEEIDYSKSQGAFGIQVKYKDSPDIDEREKRKELIDKYISDIEIYEPGEYINNMIGDVVGQIDSVKFLILAVILFINLLVTILMVRSFIIKEKGEIAMLKAIGFKNRSIIAWQSLRIGIVLLISVLIGTIIATPLSELSAGQVFKMMGVYSIEFVINPMEVFVMYPLIVLAVTVVGAIIASLGIRKIETSEISNIE